ncbi:hypothetical protein BKA82DRAFT_1005357 [Pisolithus tinctorius]|uniref:Uncharacterized protein n=1 Tax=Pisolithus tinctorius Marx 270 TaxID=870435 RepID=A0A0C3NSB1_PISTI|nr:hypothetical protein BKA82DRAFT_1005357 [Pisolithus tinctorius]KIN98375.1 hypothetical protein M404DRAFT_1005357 [Pisolithus tinctorius Marx 270]
MCPALTQSCDLFPHFESFPTNDDDSYYSHDIDNSHRHHAIRSGVSTMAVAMVM